MIMMQTPRANRKGPNASGETSTSTHEESISRATTPKEELT
jgi:hypothetical protein